MQISMWNTILYPRKIKFKKKIDLVMQPNHGTLLYLENAYIEDSAVMDTPRIAD